jgi:translation elongation factor P/translation initiation factor 5A
MVIKIKSKTFKNNQYQSREESKTTILLDKALVEATKKVQRTIRTLRVTRKKMRYLERINFSCFMYVIRRIVCNMRN